MSSGFPGGGSDFYAGLASRSVNNAMNGNLTSAPSSQTPYRSQQQQQQQHPSTLQGIFIDTTSSSQIANRSLPNLIGKRSFSDFQTHHQHQPQNQPLNLNPVLNNLYLRSVKPRTFQNMSPISPLSPMDFSSNNNILSSPDLQHSFSYRYGLPLLHQQQQLRSQQQQQQQFVQGHVSGLNVSQVGPAISGVSNMSNPVQNRVNMVDNRLQSKDSEKKMLNRLQELEKQLLDDNDEEELEGDAVSVITNTNSEWSETIQNLISLSPKPVSPVSPSPTSSASSSSSSSSVASPATSCSKQTIIEAASAISEGKNDVASETLARMSQASNSKGNSEQRLLEYMTLALKSRVNPVENPPPSTELFSKDHVTSTQLLYDLSPCFKLGFMAANLAILEETLDQPNSNKFHVIDFDIGQGGQYMNLLHALSARQNGKPSLVKITALIDNGDEGRLKLVGELLNQFAEQVGVCLQFNVMSLNLGDLSRDSLGCEPDETLAINFAFQLFRMPDESVSTDNPRDELLRRVKGLAPRVVTLVEQEMNTNTAPFMARVNETCAYYGALLDSIDSTVPRDNSDRSKVEEGLSRKLANSVACEGRDRIERCEVFGKWRARMSMAGFELKPMSQNVAESMRNRLSSGNRVHPGFTVKEENGGVYFGWMGRTLTVASAWR